MKHTNKLTDEELLEELGNFAEILATVIDKLNEHERKLAQLRLTNLQNEKQYRETIQKETICH